MTLDEMIAFVSDEAARETSSAYWAERGHWSADSVADFREHAAALICVENALRRMRAMADEASGEIA